MKWFFTVALATVMLTGCNGQFVVLDPKGPVGKQELDLIILSTVLTLIVIIPVLIMLWIFVAKYRDKPGNKAPYKPEWEDNKTLEIIWWGIPIVIIGILGVYTAKTTFALTKPPVQNVAPITIQVTSLDWKWLFQYPGQKIATVNYVEIPAGVPVNFVLTSDAPVNSFWVPQLGGQEYTMPGMALTLWLQADKPGSYLGMGANFTGEGFAHMRFHVIAKPQSDFNAWVNHVKQTAPALTKAGYQNLTQPSVTDQMSFSSYPDGLFEATVNKNGGIYMPMQQGNMKKEDTPADNNAMKNMKMGQ
ncbi:COX aromatic rich motif-containing protein [Fodinisporobacter ferrooxydans]|uniref:Quinol oxidase subunit 2 n=2 Tax=Fodinisporobacter ferrooxydans TaxID=2901836 RepID=A0ABY4CT52_9BACL|nr:COX aromatic rich motif-containing protein [Alicyclobacillaceae bacterium MYW30-H2]